MRRMAGLWAVLLLVLALTPVQAGAVELPIRAEAALLMEKETGQVLYAQNEHEALEPASVTKVMTLLLTMEAIDKGSLHYDDVVTVSAYAASMGGSHVYLSEGEQITGRRSAEGGVRGQRQRRRRGAGGVRGRGDGAVCGADEHTGQGAGHDGHPLRQLHRPSGGGTRHQRMGHRPHEPGAHTKRTRTSAATPPSGWIPCGTAPSSWPTPTS